MKSERIQVTLDAGTRAALEKLARSMQMPMSKALGYWLAEHRIQIEKRAQLMDGMWEEI